MTDEVVQLREEVESVSGGRERGRARESHLAAYYVEDFLLELCEMEGDKSASGDSSPAGGKGVRSPARGGEVSLWLCKEELGTTYRRSRVFLQCRRSCERTSVSWDKQTQPAAISSQD